MKMQQYSENASQLIYYDSVDNLLKMFTQFDDISINLLKCNNLKEFDYWLVKCIRLDKRCTLLFLRRFKDKISDDYIFYAQHFFKNDIYNPVVGNKVNNNSNSNNNSNNSKYTDKNYKNNNDNNNSNNSVNNDGSRNNSNKRGLRLRWKK